MFVYLAFLFLSQTITSATPCKRLLTVDITDGFLDRSTGNVTKNDITYSPQDYFVEDDSIRGCLCNLKKCVRKCCLDHEEVHSDLCLPMSAERYFMEDIPVRSVDRYSFVSVNNFLECSDGITTLLSPKTNGISEHFKVDSKGVLVHRFKYVTQQDYCLDYFTHDDTISALICQRGAGRRLTYLGMIISMPFLLVTFLVYAILPERNLPAKALMCYVLSLFFAYIMLVTIQLSSLDRIPCSVIAFLCYFFFMVSFFWMNSSCIDIWLTFSGIKGMTGQRTHERKRFMYYSLYSWGIPLIMVCIVIWANQSSSIPKYLHPGIGDGQCWFINQLQTGVYFYFPIAFLVGSNIVLFAITAIKIIQVQRDTKMLNAKDSTKHENDKQRDDVCSDQICLTNRVENRGFEVYDFLDEDNSCFRFNLYVKLVFAMGVNWSMEIISWVVMWQIKDSAGWIWYLTDFCNAMYGVFIFFIFVFKKNIWILLKKRYLQFTGKPQQAHRYGLSSTHRTTVSQVTSTSEA